MKSLYASHYLREIQKYPLLSSSEEHVLSVEISKGSQTALKTLINSNLRLVFSVASKFQVSASSFQDLIQEGTMGLMIAAKKFNGSYNTRFSTYAYPWILQYMLRYVNSECNLIQIPHRKNELIKRIEKAREYLGEVLGHSVSDEQICLFMQIDIETYREALNYTFSYNSFDMPVADDSCACIGDFIQDKSMNAEDKLLYDEERKEIRSLMDTLPENEKKVIWYRFNFDGEKKCKTLREISTIIGISPEAVRQTELRALKHMKLNVAV